jgi:hypothetical protein
LEKNLISATVILDSITKAPKNPPRLTTFELVLPKQFMAQLNTHRALSKNASSARAIPVPKFLKSVMTNPVIPIWTMNRPGMTGELADPQHADNATEVWLEARDSMMGYVQRLSEMGMHKQTANRLLEPWFYTKVVCSATNLEWFYHLRIADTAQGEIEQLASCMKAAQDASVPQTLGWGEWHIPYILPEEADLDLETKKKVSVARCARVSYKTHDNDLLSTIEKDLKLYHQLFDDLHPSPYEHQATPADYPQDRSGNFEGWVQYRQQLNIFDRSRS